MSAHAYGKLSYDTLVLEEARAFQVECARLAQKLPTELFFNFPEDVAMGYFRVVVEMGMLRSFPVEFASAVAFMAAVYRSEPRLGNDPKTPTKVLTDRVLKELAVELADKMGTDAIVPVLSLLKRTAITISLTN